MGRWTHVGIGWGVSPGQPEPAAPNYTAAAMDGLPFEDSGRRGAAGAGADPRVRAGPAAAARLPRPGVGAAWVRGAVRVPPGPGGLPAPEEDTEAWDDNGGAGWRPDAVAGLPLEWVSPVGERAPSGRVRYRGPLASADRAAAPAPRLRRCGAAVRGRRHGSRRRLVDRRDPRHGRAHPARLRRRRRRAGVGQQQRRQLPPLARPRPRRRPRPRPHPRRRADGLREPADGRGVRGDDPRAGVVAGQRFRRPGDRGDLVVDQAGVGAARRSRRRRGPAPARRRRGRPEAAPGLRRVPGGRARPGPRPGGRRRGRGPGHRAHRDRGPPIPT